MIRDAMIEAGVAAERIRLVPDEQEAMHAALTMGQRGDIVLLFADALARSWKQVVHFKPEGNGDAMTATGPHRSAPALEHATQPVASLPIGDDVTLVRDERGVRLARESDD